MIEAVSLYPKDLELADGSVRVLNGKGGRSRTVGLDPGGGGIIERWLDARSRLGLGGRQPLIIEVATVAIPVRGPIDLAGRNVHW